MTATPNSTMTDLKIVQNPGLVPTQSGVSAWVINSATSGPFRLHWLSLFFRLYCTERRYKH